MTRRSWATQARTKTQVSARGCPRYACSASYSARAGASIRRRRASGRSGRRHATSPAREQDREAEGADEADRELDREHRRAADAATARGGSGCGEHDEGARPDDLVHQHGRDRLGARSGAPGEVDRPHRVAADRGRQHLAEQQRDEGRLEQPAEPGLVSAAGDEQHAPALGHHEHREQVHDESGEEPAGREGGDRLPQAVWTRLPQDRGEQQHREADLERDAPCAMHGAESADEPRVRVAQHADDVVDVVKRVRGRERQRQHLARGELGVRQAQLGIARPVPGQLVDGEEVQARPDLGLAQRLGVRVAVRPRDAPDRCVRRTGGWRAPRPARAGDRRG